MSLYLTSSFRGRGVADLVLGDIEKKIGKPTTEIKVLYIITAGNLHPEAERDWIIEGRQILQKHGCQIFDYDIEGKTEQKVETATQGMDVIFVQGGQCIYMLEQAQKCNLADIVKRALERGVSYIGESTGSIIAGRDISAYRFWARDRRENPPLLASYSGMGLVNFLIRPHWNHPEKCDKYLEMTRENLEELYNITQPIIILNDNQLVYVDDDGRLQIWEG